MTKQKEFLDDFINAVRIIIKNHVDIDGEFSEISFSMVNDFIYLLDGTHEFLNSSGKYGLLNNRLRIYPIDGNKNNSPMDFSFNNKEVTLDNLEKSSPEYEFISMALMLSKYWEGIYEKTGDKKDALDGIIFSILNNIDGMGGLDYPIDIIVQDKNGTNICINDDIMLHEYLF